MLGKRKHKWKPYDICSLIYKKSVSRFYYENIEFQILDVAFLILLSVSETNLYTLSGGQLRHCHCSASFQ